MFANLVILAVNFWNVTLSWHFRLTRCSCSYQKARWEKCPSYNICLIGRNKEREEKFPQPHFAMLQCTNTWRPLVFSLSQRSLKFRSKSNERSTSVSSHRNIWDYLRSDYRNLPFRFWQTGSLPCFSYVRNSEKELKLRESDSLWLARFDGKFLGYSHIWSTPH